METFFYCLLAALIIQILFVLSYGTLRDVLTIIAKLIGYIVGISIIIAVVFAVIKGMYLLITL